jgi:hypothetical protein
MFPPFFVRPSLTSRAIDIKMFSSISHNIYPGKSIIMPRCLFGLYNYEPADPVAELPELHRSEVDPSLLNKIKSCTFALVLWSLDSLSAGKSRKEFISFLLQHWRFSLCLMRLEAASQLIDQSKRDANDLSSDFVHAFAICILSSLDLSGKWL